MIHNITLNDHEKAGNPYSVYSIISHIISTVLLAQYY